MYGYGTGYLENKKKLKVKMVGKARKYSVNILASGTPLSVVKKKKNKTREQTKTHPSRACIHFEQSTTLCERLHR